MALQFFTPKQMDPTQNAGSFDLGGDTGSYVKWDVRALSTVCIQAVKQTVWGTATLIIERSLDGTNWSALETTESFAVGGGMSSTIDCSGFAYIRVRITLTEGSSKFATITAFGKASA